MMRPHFTEEQVEWIDAKFKELKITIKGNVSYTKYMTILSYLNEFYAMILLDKETEK